MAEKNRIFITGDLGFIASHLKRRLLEDGYEVRGWDIKRSLNEDIRLLKAKDLEGFDYVFHMSAQAKVPLSIEKPLFTHSHNVDGTLSVLETAKEAGVKRVIYSASSSAYGDQAVLPLNEDMNPNPMSPYGVQKLIGEHYCRIYSSCYGLPTVSLRYFNVYGEDMPADNPYSAAIATFLRQRSEGRPLTVLGGLQTRDFTYVGDVVEANVLAIKGGLGIGEVINIGSGQNYSIDEIAEAISGDIEHFPQREGEPMNTLADITKAREFLGWKPVVDVIQWLKSYAE